MLLNSDDDFDVKSPAMSVPKVDYPELVDMGAGEEEMDDEHIIDLLYSGLPPL